MYKSKEECKHKRIRKNYPFGKNSKPIIFCKDCGKVLSPRELNKLFRKNKRKNINKSTNVKNGKIIKQ